MIGLRYNFGQPPPPPPPAPAAVPAPAPTRSYLVFFDWDKYSLTDRARQIIAEAAANSTKVQYTRIEVNGYTDTSGTPNRLGYVDSRANAVKAELIKDGVPESAITAKGFGDTVLLVPTGPGVREPQTGGWRSSFVDVTYSGVSSRKSRALRNCFSGPCRNLGRPIFIHLSQSSLAGLLPDSPYYEPAALLVARDDCDRLGLIRFRYSATVPDDRLYPTGQGPIANGLAIGAYPAPGAAANCDTFSVSGDEEHWQFRAAQPGSVGHLTAIQAPGKPTSVRARMLAEHLDDIAGQCHLGTGGPAGAVVARDLVGARRHNRLRSFGMSAPLLDGGV